MLKCFDYKCNLCGREQLDVIMPQEKRAFLCDAVVHEEGFISPSYCQGTMERAWLGKPASVVGDECDVEVKHGLCNADGSPQRFRSKSEMARAAKERGLVNCVEHLGSMGSDKSKHTVRWI